MNEHIPGPWKWGYRLSRQLEIFKVHEIGVLIPIATINKDHRENARLIAASPELYSALKAILLEVEAYGELYEPGGNADKLWQRAIKLAQAAIKKAEK